MMRNAIPGWMHKNLTRTLRRLLFVGLGLAVILVLGLQPQIAQSQGPGMPQTAAANHWQGASFPVENFQAYTSPFGYRQSPTGGYTREFHSGLDIAAPMGSYIRNWWAGTVSRAIDDDRCGIGLVINSGDWEHIYCHMQGAVERSGGRRYLIDRTGGLQIFEGQQVPAGVRIGRVGMSGRSTGPHLHWGLRYANEWYDPALILRAMYSSSRSVSMQR